MQNYELTCLASPELTEEEQKSLQERVSSLIQAENGAIVEIKGPVKRIPFFAAKRREAISTMLEFQMETEKTPGLEKKLRDEKQLLRFFLMIKPKIKEITRQRRRELAPPIKPAETETKEPKVKVEIAEIEKKLEEILGPSDEGKPSSPSAF